MRRTTLTLAGLAASLALALPGANAFAAGEATTSDADTRAARELYKQGNKAADAQRWDDALALWRKAETLSPSWQYAFNQASVLAFRERWLDAWEASERAVAHGVPPDHRKQVDRERAKIEAQLLRDHAWLELSVDPQDAEVTLDGAPWPPPRRMFVERAASALRVARDGYRTVERPWNHAIGGRHSQIVQLERLPEAPVGTLAIPSGSTTGTAPGAAESAENAPLESAISGLAGVRASHNSSPSPDQAGGPARETAGRQSVSELPRRSP